jgi:hypothetical protein
VGFQELRPLSTFLDAFPLQVPRNAIGDPASFLFSIVYIAFIIGGGRSLEQTALRTAFPC